MLLNAFRPHRSGTGFRFVNVPSQHRPVIFGGQLIGQMGLAAAAGAGGKTIRSIQAVFARAGSVDRDVTVETDVVHDGRTLASVAVRVRQGDRRLCAGLVLLDAGDPDVIRHAAPMPSVSGPADAEPVEVEDGSELRLVDGRSIMDAGATGPATVHAWARFPGVDSSADDGLHRVLAAWYTDGLLIGAAMRPHPLGLDMAHETVSTGVLTHSVTFHEPCDASRWLLVTQTSTQAGGGRCYGTGAVYTQDGGLVASFAQEAMIRAFPATQTGRGTAAMVM